MPRNSTMLSSRAYTELKERIAGMPTGQYLSARQYSKELGMSYTPVREAFLKLQSEGVLRQVPNVGFFVASPDLSEMIQFFQVRECIEVFALRKVFTKLRAEKLAAMLECCDEQHAALERGDSRRAMRADEAFHRMPLEMLGNTALLNMYDTIRTKYMLCIPMLADGDYDLGEQGHRQIIEFIRTHHGTRRTEYFYIMEKREHPNEEVDPADFTYHGPVPFSKETAVLMICDSVEAASRSLKEPDEANISKLVDNIIQKQMDDGQFLNVDLTMRDFTTIKKVLKKKLMSIYHVRIAYPDK